VGKTSAVDVEVAVRVGVWVPAAARGDGVGVGGDKRAGVDVAVNVGRRVGGTITIRVRVGVEVRMGTEVGVRGLTTIT
jgi:hypothetical protein